MNSSRSVSLLIEGDNFYGFNGINSSLWNFATIKSLLHTFRSWLMRSDTFHSRSSLLGEWITTFVRWFRIHLSVKTLTSEPSPILQQQPNFKIGIFVIMLFHTYEQFGTSVTSKKWHRGKHLALKHWYIKESCCRISLHPCFANMAKLKVRRSLKPNPPIFLASVSLLQLVQWIFLSSPSCPHQNLAHIALSSSHSILGNWNTPMEYVRID